MIVYITTWIIIYIFGYFGTYGIFHKWNAKGWKLADGDQYYDDGNKFAAAMCWPIFWPCFIVYKFFKWIA